MVIGKKSVEKNAENEYWKNFRENERIPRSSRGEVNIIQYPDQYTEKNGGKKGKIEWENKTEIMKKLKITKKDEEKKD